MLSRRKRDIVLLSFKLGLAVAIIVWLLVGIDLSRFAAAIRHASVPLLVASVAAFVADDLLVTHKWRRLLDGVAIDVGFYRLFRVYLKGRFIGFFIPSSVTSDLYKGAVLTREYGSGKAIVSSIVLERLLGLVSIATISVMAVSVLPVTLFGMSVASSVVVAAAATLVGLGMFLQADRIAGVALAYLPARWTRLQGFIHELAAAFSAYRGRMSLLVETYFLSLLIQGTRSLGVFLLARALGDGTPFHYFLLLVPYVYLVHLLPSASSRLGLEQGVFVVLFTAVGMPPETALAVSLLSVAGSLVAAIPGGVWLMVEP